MSLLLDASQGNVPNILTNLVASLSARLKEWLSALKNYP